MKARFFLLIFFFAVFFVFKSAVASSVQATATTVYGTFDNRVGKIDMTVTVQFLRRDGTQLGSLGSVTATAGHMSGLITSANDTSSNPIYSIIWTTACGAGSVLAYSDPGPPLGNFKFDPPEVYCTNANSTISMISTTCAGSTGNVQWKLNLNPSPNNIPNIANFKVYKAMAPSSADTDTSPATVPVGVSPYTYSNDLTGLSIGTYNFKVIGYTNSPNGDIILQFSGQFTCGVNTAIATNLTSGPKCTGTYPNMVSGAELFWTPATGATFDDQKVEYSEVDDLQYGVTSVSVLPVTTGTTSITGLFIGHTYYWRVKTHITGGVWNLSAIVSLVAPCSPASNLMQSICAGNDPDMVSFTWNKGLPPPGDSLFAQRLEYATDLLFTQNVGIWDPDNQVSSTTVSSNFTNGQKYYWRIKTVFTYDVNTWIPSVPGSFIAPSACATPPAQTSANFTITINPTQPTVNPTLNGTQAYNVIVVNTSTTLSIRVDLTSYFNHAGISSALSSSALPSIPPSNFNIVQLTLTFTDLSQLTAETINFSVAGVGSGNGFGTQVKSAKLILNPVAAPSGLTAAASCVSSAPQIVFSWNDMSTNEDLFWLDVSSDPFTGPGTTTRDPSSVWGVKTRNSSAGEKSGTGSRTFTWNNTVPTNTAGTLDVSTPPGNANGGITGSELVPLENTRYYWRLRAHTASTDSVHIYSGDATIATGNGITTGTCSVPKHDLSATIVPGSWRVTRSGQVVTTQSFLASEDVSVDITVTNVAGANISATTLLNLYFYYKGPPPSGQTMPACPTINFLPPPLDGTNTGNNSNYFINPLAPGNSQTITVTFNVGTAVGAFTAYGYVVPNCKYDPFGTELDTNWPNNKSDGFSYTVGVNRYFWTTGGDVGAKGKISVGIASPPSIYQSDYMLGAKGDIVTAVAKTTVPVGYTIKNYSKDWVLPGGVYKYFTDRFRAKAITNDNAAKRGCNITSRTYTDYANNLYYCADSVTISDDTTITGTPVFFIDGDLNINNNLHLSTSPVSWAVYIVNGSIYVHPDVTEMKGVFIARKSFNDGINGGSSSLGALVITGALYVDGESGGKMQLDRYWEDISSNDLFPSLKVIYDPGYIIVLNTILSSPAVGWNEAAP